MPPKESILEKNSAIQNQISINEQEKKYVESTILLKLSKLFDPHNITMLRKKSNVRLVQKQKITYIYRKSIDQKIEQFNDQKHYNI